MPLKEGYKKGVVDMEKSPLKGTVPWSYERQKTGSDKYKPGTNSVKPFSYGKIPNK